VRRGERRGDADAVVAHRPMLAATSGRMLS
jgi:hypothetical protein